MILKGADFEFGRFEAEKSEKNTATYT